MPRLAYNVLSAARDMPELDISICVSRQSESFNSYSEFWRQVVALDTFKTNAGALLNAWRIPLLRRQLAAEVSRREIATVIELMPHVWSSFLMPALRGAGARYFVVAHDADAHPGDATALVKGLVDRTLRDADGVITLSDAVSARLISGGQLPSERLHTLFLPDIIYDEISPTSARPVGTPLRVLFFGRIMPYKGLSLFVSAAAALQRAGIPIEIGVFGEGDLGRERESLAALGAEVVNRWLSEKEIAHILGRYDVVVVSHIEASQSAVVATAFGAGLPVIATPVGGLLEQVTDGVTGLVADSVSADALSATIARLALDSSLYATLRDGVRLHRGSRSMARFVSDCAALVRSRPLQL